MASSDDATEEALAALGSSVANVDTYESNVLREATLQSAPTLTSVVFPDLAPLAPSYDARRNAVLEESADTPHVKTLLKRTRVELTRDATTEHRRNVLSIKEQLLLTYMKTVSNLSPDEMPRAENKKRPSPKKPPAAILKQDGSVAREITSSSTSASFGKQALDSSLQGTKRRRVSMMQQKQQARPDVPNQEDEELKVQLRQRRKEREERRQKRKEQWGMESSSDEEEEVSFDDDNDVRPDEPGAQQKTPATAASVIACPICNERLQGGDSQEESDAILSQHIQSCQLGGRRTRGRARATNSPLTSTTEQNDVAAEEWTKTTRQVKRKKKSTKQRRVYQPRSDKPPVDDFQDWDYEDRVDEWIESGLERMREMNERDQAETPPGAVTYDGGLRIPGWMNDRLFGYQRTGLQWMWELHQQEAGGVVGDEMGLGKTVQVCAFLGAMAASRKMDSTLIIGPATMLQHWLTELSIWAPGLRRILIHKSGEADGLPRNVTHGMLRNLDKWLRTVRADRVYEMIDADDFDEYDETRFCGTGYVVITTYENIRRFPDIWTGHNWTYVVMDEGQKIRNPDADITIACKRMRTPHRLLLSGTPIQNDLRELWSLFDFVFPGRLGTLPAFEAEFSDPIRRGGYSNASPMQVQLAYRCALVLRDLINPYLLRRQKKDIKEVSRMPGKTEQVLFCRLSSRQRGLYEAFLQSDAVTSILRGSPQLLGAVTVLRKICNHPDLVCGPDQSSFDDFVREGFGGQGCLDESLSDDDEDAYTDESMVERAGKLEVLAKILPLWREQGHRVLIFCQWRKMLNIIERFTQLQGWKFGRLDGNTNVASRQRLVDAFNTDDSYFGMLMTTRTGGVGLNLTGADRIILYDPDWNPQTDAQARERAWRFGQKNQVTVYRLITAGTIEEKIYQRQIFKTALTNKILQDPRQRRLFSHKDLRDFFTLKADVGSVSSGGVGMTETGELTKGDGVVDPDDTGDKRPVVSENSAKDDVNTLQEVLKSKGLAGVFDHDVVDGAKSKKTSTAREMEERAKIVARNAAKALKESSTGTNPFEPTWTGSAETGSATRFGGRPSFSTNSAASVGANRSFGDAGTVGVGRSATDQSMGSSALLANLKKRSDPTKANSESRKGDTSRYAKLMKRIEDFVSRKGGHRPGKGPTTDEILKEFENVADCDAAIFRRLLNNVALVERGRWRLKG